MADLLFLALSGLAGSLHCLGMCGPLAVLLGPSSTARNLLYNLGRVSTYAFLGGLAGTAGGAAFDWVPLPSLPRILALFAGVLLVGVGCRLLGLASPISLPRSGLGAEAFARVLRGVRQAPGPFAPLAFGVFHGFLPCPLVYAFLAAAASTGSTLRGASTMAAFGLGTLPAMLLAGGVGGLLREGAHLRRAKLAGTIVIALGLLAFARGAFGHRPGSPLGSCPHEDVVAHE